MPGGWQEGGDNRQKAGLIRGGPSVVVTTKGVMRFYPDTKEMYLASYHPGLTARAVADDTGFPLARYTWQASEQVRQRMQ